jgi:hypothetical protein
MTTCTSNDRMDGVGYDSSRYIGLERSSLDLASSVTSLSGGTLTGDKEISTYTMGFVASTTETPYPQLGPNNGSDDRGRMSLATMLSDGAEHDQHDQHKLANTTSIDAEYTWNESSLRHAVSDQQMTRGSFDQIALYMHNLGKPQAWCSNPRFYFLLYKTNRLDLLGMILEAGVTDLWLPLPKRLVRKWLDEAETKSYISYQELVLDKDFPAYLQGDLQGRHYSLDSMEDLELSQETFLGAGGFGEVHKVRSKLNDQVFACKTMARPVRYKDHHDLMQNFHREVSGMRRVRHRHCVDLVASCTDQDSVSIISSPVADMDLATFMELDLDDSQYGFLETAIGCITCALSYLHSLHIRSVCFVCSPGNRNSSTTGTMISSHRIFLYVIQTFD